MDQIYLKGQYGLSCIVLRYKFIKNISRSQKKAFYRTLLRILERNVPMLLYPNLNLLKMFASTTQIKPFLIKTD